MHKDRQQGRYPSSRVAYRYGIAQQGFTLIEIIIVVAIIAVALAVVLPNIVGESPKRRTQSFLTEAETFLTVAKQEAARRGVPVVVELDYANDRLFAFANVDTDSDLDYQPDSSQPNRTADYEVRSLALPTAGNTFILDFRGPTDGAPRGAGATTGMSLDGDGNPVFVFQPNGSVRDVGAIRFSDLKLRNFFELRVDPAVSARIRVLKYNSSTDFDGPGFLPRGLDSTSGKSHWTWN